jgi:hypothetical protein
MLQEFTSIFNERRRATAAPRNMNATYNRSFESANHHSDLTSANVAAGPNQDDDSAAKTAKEDLPPTQT